MISQGLGLVLMLCGVIMVGSGMFQMQRGPGLAGPRIIQGFMFIVIGVFFPTILRFLFTAVGFVFTAVSGVVQPVVGPGWPAPGADTEATTADPEPTPEPESEPDRAAPSVESDPVDPTSLADLPWGWLLFFAVAVVLVIVAGFGGYHTWAVTRRAAKNRKAERVARDQQRKLHAEQWADLRARGQAAVDSWLAYETDLGLLLRFPVMADLTDPVVQQVVGAVSKVRPFLRLDKPSDPDADVVDSSFAQTVRNLETCLAAAERHAQKVRDSRFDPDERKQLELAKVLLGRAMDAGNFPHERHQSYQRVVRILEGLLPVPDKALAQLAAAVNEAMALEPGKESAAQDVR